LCEPFDYALALTPFLPATVFFLPLRVRALLLVRCPRTGRPRRWPIAPVAADVLEPLDVLLHLATQRTLDEIVRVDDRVDRGELILVELVGARIRAHLRLGQDVGRELRADPVDVLQREEDLLLVRNVDTCDTWHA
jgi:hypothetical protein